MRVSVLLSLVLVTLFGIRVEAHHSFGAEYDGDKPITLKGTVTKIDWANPHCHFYMNVTDATGKVTNWKFEGYPPNVLARTGFKKDETLKIGDSVSVYAWLARDGTPLAHAREVTLASGQKRFFGPPAGTGEGAPLR